MKQEDKELLLKDLCARLPYGVKIHHGIPTLLISIKSDRDGMKIITEGSYGEHIFDIEDMKPYLRPMSSMTEEEIFDYVASTKEERCIPELPIQPRAESTDWLNKHHFDYRGLIQKGLALEAPEDMYKIKL